MEANIIQESAIPNQPQEPVCTNPVWYDIFGTEQEREIFQASLMQQEQERSDKRYRQLIADIEQAIDTEINYQL